MLTEDPFATRVLEEWAAKHLLLCHELLTVAAPVMCALSAFAVWPIVILQRSARMLTVGAIATLGSEYSLPVVLVPFLRGTVVEEAAVNDAASFWEWATVGTFARGGAFAVRHYELRKSDLPHARHTS